MRRRATPQGGMQRRSNASVPVVGCTWNAAPRAVFESKLTGTMTKTAYSNLFRGSGQFTTADRGTFRVLVVDEAHRLNEKSGLYRNLGDNSWSVPGV